MKVYEMSNLDGVNACMVAAGTLKEAALQMGTTPYQMRQMGWHYASGRDAEIALAKPMVAFFRPVTHRDQPWREKRYTREQVRP